MQNIYFFVKLYSSKVPQKFFTKFIFNTVKFENILYYVLL